jgi:hypothetical protein
MEKETPAYFSQAMLSEDHHDSCESEERNAERITLRRITSKYSKTGKTKRRTKQHKECSLTAKPAGKEHTDQRMKIVFLPSEKRGIFKSRKEYSTSCRLDCQFSSSSSLLVLKTLTEILLWCCYSFRTVGHSFFIGTSCVVKGTT